MGIGSRTGCSERVAPAALLLFLSLLGCQDAKLAGPQCDVGSTASVGLWSHTSLPGGVFLPGGGAAASDGDRLIALGSGCSECSYHSLNAATPDWEEITGIRLSERSSGVGLFATPDFYYLVATSRSESSSGELEYRHQRLTYDRTEQIWRELSLPDGVDALGKVHWTGSQFLHWGRTDTENSDLTPREIAEDPDTPWLWFYEGHLLDPSTGAWTHIPAAREDARYLMSEGGPSLESVWTPSGLFVWGTNPERTEQWGALLHVDTMTWEILEGGGDAPPLLQSHRMLALGEDVFLFAGVTPGNNAAWRRLWRYSVPSRTWTEVDVPAWADPLVGTVVRDRIAFLGRCGGGDLYDPKTNTWKPLASEGAPPSEGIPRGAGSFLTVTDTYVGEQETNQVWILDLRQELGE